MLALVLAKWLLTFPYRATSSDPLPPPIRTLRDQSGVVKPRDSLVSGTVTGITVYSGVVNQTPTRFTFSK